MRKVIVALLCALLVTPAFAAEPPKEAPAKEQKPLTPEEQKAAAEAAAKAAAEAKAQEKKTLYDVGLMLARQLKVFALSEEEFGLVLQGVKDGAAGKAPVDTLDAATKRIQDLAAARRAAQGQKLTLAKAKEFIDGIAEETGATKTETGMVYKVLKEGTGASPMPVDKVKVNYIGTYIDGTEFDNTYKKGKPAEVPLGSAIRCWSEGLPMMKVGGKARLVCPPSNAYGDKGAGIVPPNATLIFDVELLSVN